MSPRFLPVRSVVAVVAAVLVLLVLPAPLWPAEAATEVDTALVVAVDVSNSVDEERYRLQMEGIAQALEDDGVINAITGGTRGAILFTIVAWADRADVALPWRRIASRAEALSVAHEVRHLRRFGGEFTCLGRMFRALSSSLVSEMPGKPARVVIDVSGDGTDNCSPDTATDAARDTLVGLDTTINGLPIIEKEGEVVGSGAYRAPGNSFETLPAPRNDEALTLDVWYRRHVIGGAGAFLMPAHGYADFGRAMRQKFVTEISGLASPKQID